MMRRSLAAAVAIAPLLVASAGQVRAETQITTATTAPVATATAKAGAPDDVHVTSTGLITLTTNTAAAVTLNSSNTVTNDGTISFKDVDNAVGILVVGANAGQVVNTGGILITETYAATDTNADGIVDGPWSKQTGGIGIEVKGGVFTGSIAHPGGITINGNGSAGISIESEVTGSLLERTTTTTTVAQGTISVTGSNAVGVIITKSGQVDGDVRLTSVTARGDGAKGVEIDGKIGGMLNVAGTVSVTGYRATARSTDTVTMAKYTADELQQGGAGVTIAADVGGGVIISARPPTTKDTLNTDDTDGDLVPDLVQGTGLVSSLGGAPALQIGAVGADVTIGPLAKIDKGYGLVIQGTVQADGLFDRNATPNLAANVTATGVQIGVAGGGATTITGGMHNTGAISANAYEDDATGLHIGAGAVVSVIVNDGTITAAATSAATTTPNATSSGILIDKLATVGSISNTKSIVASIQGTLGATAAITDNSGTVTNVSNTGVIAAGFAPTTATAVVVGTSTAIDVSQNTKGVTITQTQSAVTGATAPAITGRVLFGAGDDVFSVSAGTVTGDISFGKGANALTVSGATTIVKGALTDGSDHKLKIDVQSGTLSITNPETIAANSVHLGATGVLLVSADPQTNKDRNTLIETSGASKFDSGGQIGLSLQSLQVEDHTYHILKTVGTGTLQTGTFGTASLEGAPYLYTATATANGALGTIDLTVQRRTAAQLAFNSAETVAYNEVFNALLKDTSIQKAFLAQTTRSGLIAVYDQLLPDSGQGVFDTIDQTAEAISNLTGTQPDAGARVAGTSLWLQEVNERVHRRSGDTLGSQSQLFGLVGGYEHMGAGGGALGATFSYLNLQDRDSASAVNEHTVASLLEGGIYYRRAIGGLRLSARGGAGYAFFSGNRYFISPGVSRHATSTWGAAFADAHFGAAYEVRFGRFYARPELSADYLYLREGAHTEAGGGDGFDLNIASRASHRFSGAAIVTVGAQFGRDAWFRPELRAGYRSIFAGQMGDTTAQFSSSTTPFTLGGAKDSGGWLTVGFSLKGGTSLSYVAFEGDADFRDGEQRYDIRFAGRSMF